MCLCKKIYLRASLLTKPAILDVVQILVYYLREIDVPCLETIRSRSLRLLYSFTRPIIVSPLFIKIFNETKPCIRFQHLILQGRI